MHQAKAEVKAVQYSHSIVFVMAAITARVVGTVARKTMSATRMQMER